MPMRSPGKLQLGVPLEILNPGVTQENTMNYPENKADAGEQNIVTFSFWVVYQARLSKVRMDCRGFLIEYNIENKNASTHVLHSFVYKPTKTGDHFHGRYFS